MQKKMNWQSVSIQKIMSWFWLLWVAILAYFLAILFWMLYPVPVEPVTAELINLNPKSSNQVINNQAQSQARKIANAKLFGSEPVKKTVTAKPKKEVSLSKLPFEIVATAASSDPKNGIATFRKSGKTKTFSVGERVFDQAVLFEVYSQSVVFERDNGQLETLEMKKTKFKVSDYVTESDDDGLGPEFDINKNAEFTIQNTSRAPTKPSNQSTRSTVNNVSKNRASNAKPNNGILTQQQLDENPKLREQANRYVESLKKQAQKNPNQFVNSYGAKIDEKSCGGNGGYLLTRNVRPELKLIGLKSGDIVCTVNGNAIGNPSQDLTLVDQVLQSGEVQATYERRGILQTLKVTIPTF